ncbi:subtilisin-like serine protease family protein [Rhizoctonia solani AG-3 Rhs1AP]|uniref:Subtilisin-like serine protease family protein n=3 Tax=Rhizoctonia solani TaxID=456999 RepID=A0A074RM58_9AGAM|nr:subtilisin-like serine protease family protein [Rhizoctonia solani AG-3 Rhs1AP]KEP45763.1 subtilisin-like serine protease family protein [Rhizoctonia solani 123E]
MALENHWIVLLKDDTGVSTDNHMDWVSSQQSMGIASSEGGKDDVPMKINHKYQNINGYSAVLPPSILEALKARDDVDEIVADTEVTHCADPHITQVNAPWGLQRISQKESLPAGSAAGALTYQYQFASSAKSTPVDVYVIDTGVKIDHEEFEGRARWGKTFTGGADADGHGHGTHVAGTIAGKTYGVAKNANICAVKVLNDSGKGKTSDIIAAMDWVIQQAEASGRPSVINMSLGGPPNLAQDRMANRVVRSGVHCAVAAGNDSEDASNHSPARAKDVITVGATTIEDKLAEFSNFGPPVKILAPGLDIISAGIASTTATRPMSGTSMATPHVAGLIAYLLCLQGKRTPAEILTELQSKGVKDAVSGVPDDTVNLLLNNGL